MEIGKFGGIGALIGIAISFVFYIFGFSCALVNCFLTCGADDEIRLIGGMSFGSLFLFCTIGCASIGALFGLFKVYERNSAEKEDQRRNESEEAAAQRQALAVTLQQQATDIANTCRANSKKISNIVSASYLADKAMSDITDELAKTFEIEGKITAIYNEINAIGEGKDENS